MTIHIRIRTEIHRQKCRKPRPYIQRENMREFHVHVTVLYYVQIFEAFICSFVLKNPCAWPGHAILLCSRAWLCAVYISSSNCESTMTVSYLREDVYSDFFRTKTMSLRMRRVKKTLTLHWNAMISSQHWTAENNRSYDRPGSLWKRADHVFHVENLREIYQVDLGVPPFQGSLVPGTPLAIISTLMENIRFLWYFINAINKSANWLTWRTENLDSN